MYLGEITRNILVALVDAAPKGLVFEGKATHVINTQWGLDTSVMSEVEEAWEGQSIKEDDHAFSFAAFDEGKLTPGVKARLERVRIVVVKTLGYKDENVSLRDAAVSLSYSSKFTTRFPISLSTDRQVGLVVSRSSCSPPERSCCCCCLVADWPGCFARKGSQRVEEGRERSREDQCRCRWQVCVLHHSLSRHDDILTATLRSLIEFYPHYEQTMRESLRVIIGEEVERRVDIGMAKDGSGIGGKCSLILLLQAISSSLLF
jgi:hexokinase